MLELNLLIKKQPFSFGRRQCKVHIILGASALLTSRLTVFNVAIPTLDGQSSYKAVTLPPMAAHVEIVYPHRTDEHETHVPTL